MSLNELLTGTTSSKPWCNVITNDLKSATISADSVNISSLNASQFVATDSKKNLVSSTLDTSTFVTTNTNQTITGNKTFNGATYIKGNTTGTTAPTGYIGEFVSSSDSAGQLLITDSKYYNITNITLTPGNWLISGIIQVFGNTGLTFVEMDISHDIGDPTDTKYGINSVYIDQTNVSPPSKTAIPQITNYYVQITTTTTYYMKYYLDPPASPVSVYGFFQLSALRIS